MTTHVGNRDGLDERRDQVDHDDEPHRETAESTHLLQEDKLAKIVYRRVDPTPTLRQQNLPVVWRDRVRVRVPDEECLVHREVFHDQRREVSIFSEVQQILHVQRVDAVLGIVLDDLVRDEERLVGIRSAKSVHGETTGQASD